MRDFDKNDENGTKIGKLCRKRVIEKMNKKSLETKWVETIDDQEEFMVRELLRRGIDGKQEIDSAPVFLEIALVVMFKFAMGIDLRENSKRLERLLRCGKAGIEA